jgi:hypothetical protein
MNPWIALGLFGLGAGAGSLSSAILHADQIRKLKRLLEAAAYNTSKKCIGPFQDQYDFKGSSARLS